MFSRDDFGDDERSYQAKRTLVEDAAAPVCAYCFPHGCQEIPRCVIALDTVPPDTLPCTSRLLSGGALGSTQYPGPITRGGLAAK